MITQREYSLIIITVTILLLFSIGATMNFIVVKANGWKMPVLSNIEYNESGYVYYQENSEVKYHFLTDRIRFLGSIWSIGDFIMIIGASFSVIWIIYTRIEFNKWRKCQK